MDYVRCDHRKLTYKGQKLHLQGINIGNWLNLEHFMIGIPTPQRMIEEAFEEVFGESFSIKFWNNYRNKYMGIEDIDFLKSIGVNCLRLPLNQRLLSQENYMRTIDLFLNRCRERRMFVLFDLHAVIGGQNPDWHSDNGLGLPIFWKYQALQEETVLCWKRLAQRYKNEGIILGYDLLNEPVAGSWELLNGFYERAIQAIRSVDENHILFLEGEFFSMDFSKIQAFKDPQLVMEFHYYPTVWHPELLDKDLDHEQRKEKIKDGLNAILKYRNNFEGPIVCGEFGYGKDCGSISEREELLDITVELFEEDEIDWILWTYKDVGFMGLTYIKDGTAWRRMAEKIQELWNQDIEKTQAHKLIKRMEEFGYADISEDLKYRLQFRLRGCLFDLQKEYVVKKIVKEYSKEEMYAMSGDFSWENCEISSMLKACFLKWRHQGTAE